MAKVITTAPVYKGNDKVQALINLVDKWWDENRFKIAAGDVTAVTNAITTILQN